MGALSNSLRSSLRQGILGALFFSLAAPVLADRPYSTNRLDGKLRRKDPKIDAAEKARLEQLIKPITFKSGAQACALLTYPGDFLLQMQTGEDRFGEEVLGSFISKLTIGKEILSFHDPYFSYGHAEYISSVEDFGENIRTMSFYPPIFQKDRDPALRKPPFREHNWNYLDYRDSYDVFRVFGPTAQDRLRMREAAQKRHKNFQRYPKKGTCADFINWLYKNELTSWWNFIPAARQVIINTLPTEAFSTPDNLADSPFAQKRCEVRSTEWVTSPELDVYEILLDLRSHLMSRDSQIKAHAEWIRDFLQSHGVINENLEPQFGKIEVHHEAI